MLCRSLSSVFFYLLPFISIHSVPPSQSFRALCHIILVCLQPLILCSVFSVSLLNPLTPLLFICPSSSSLWPPHPLQSTLWPPRPFAASLSLSHDRTSDGNLMTDFSAFTCSQNLPYERNLCTLGPFIASGGMCCVVHAEKKDLVWLEFCGPMGKSELV